MTDRELDDLLRIRAEGVTPFPRDARFHRYEATTAQALLALQKAEVIGPGDWGVDYGCGKGRVCFFLSRFCGAHVSGVDRDPELIREALANRKAFGRRKGDGQVSFHLQEAQEYPVSPRDTFFYFFNPFSHGIFRQVLRKIQESLWEHPRKAWVILYYPSGEYREALEASLFRPYLILPAGEDFPKDPREHLAVYRYEP